MPRYGVALVGLLLITCFGALFRPTFSITSPMHDAAQYQSTLQVVATIDMVADWTTQLSEGLFEVTTIVTGLEDPHTYEPTASEVQNIEECDLFVSLGIPGLEPWMTAFIAAHPEIISKSLTLVNFTKHEYMQLDPLLSEYNGHVWMDPSNVKDMVRKIYEKLIMLDPTHESDYRVNYDNYLIELNTLINRIETAAITFAGVKVVVHHPAFFYLFKSLGVDRIGIIEEQHGSEPSADHILEIINTMIAEECQILVNQPQLEADDVIAIARATGALIADLTPLLGVYELTTYIEMIDYDLDTLAHPVPPPPVEFDSELLNSYLIIASIGTLIIVIVVILLIVYRRRT